MMVKRAGMAPAPVIDPILSMIRLSEPARHEWTMINDVDTDGEYIIINVPLSPSFAVKLPTRARHDLDREGTGNGQGRDREGTGKGQHRGREGAGKGQGTDREGTKAQGRDEKGR